MSGPVSGSQRVVREAALRGATDLVHERVLGWPSTLTVSRP
ncbi:hypothetical protein [Austwickia sp. TVS 96-490-7B]|nr:hypothetical protein [Austwickia sp. TVS 96-490-7B]